MHPDERKWAKHNAKEFAAFYEGKTGQALTLEQAENMLLANGYRLVDAYASKGPGGDATAIRYISENGSSLFAKDQYYNDPFKFGNADHSLTPEQIALNTGRPVPPPLNYTVSAGIYAGVGAEAEIGFTGLIPVNARLAFGGGIGAHGWIQGVSQGGSVDLFSYGQNLNSGDYRIGSSAGGSLILGPVAGQVNAGVGMYSNIVGTPTTGTYWQTTGGVGVSPSFGVGAEAKANIIEFSYKRK